MQRSPGSGIDASRWTVSITFQEKERARLIRRLALAVAVLALALPATVFGALPADVAVVAGSRSGARCSTTGCSWSRRAPAAPARRRSCRPIRHVQPLRCPGSGGDPEPAPDPGADAQSRLRCPVHQPVPERTQPSDQGRLAGRRSRNGRHRGHHPPRSSGRTRSTSAGSIRAPSEFRRYLRRTGETAADVKFRVCGQLIREALLKTEHLTARALDAELTQRFKPQTACARFYVMSDCARG